MIRQVLHEDVTPEMVDVLHTDYLRKIKSARDCAIRIMNMYDGLKANDPGAHKEATSEQVYAINNLFLIKGWSATCAIKRILQELENNRYGGS